MTVGGSTLELTSSDINIKSTNTTREAQAAATVKGSASAELSASGATTIKGAIVKIN